MYDTNDTEPTVDGRVDFQQRVFLVTLVQEGNDFPIFNSRHQNEIMELSSSIKKVPVRQFKMSAMMREFSKKRTYVKRGMIKSTA